MTAKPVGFTEGEAMPGNSKRAADKMFGRASDESNGNEDGT
ncbi:MAG: hypothetical protein ACYC5H_05255 [Methylovirgula sp.]